MIKATLYIELPDDQACDQNVLAIVYRSFEIEAEKHGYLLDGPILVEQGEKPGHKLIAQAVKDRS